MDEFEKAAFLFSEAGSLKNSPRTGWLRIGVKVPESIAEHMHRAALIGMVLAEMEGADPHRVAAMLVLHDFHEARVGDACLIQRLYLDMDPAEAAAVSSQAVRMPPKLAKEFVAMFNELESRSSKDAIVAKDADYLECAFQALEYMQSGHALASEWVDNVEAALKTPSAKKILAIAKKRECFCWWKGLTKDLK